MSRIGIVVVAVNIEDKVIIRFKDTLYHSTFINYYL